MIKTESEVRAFLNQFFPKFDVWGILYINREKNLEALKMLGITSSMRAPLYIKIAMGNPNDKTVCISFHLAEHPIEYAFK